MLLEDMEIHSFLVTAILSAKNQEPDIATFLKANRSFI